MSLHTSPCLEPALSGQAGHPNSRLDKFCCRACTPASQLAVYLLQALLRLTLRQVPCRQQGGQESSQQDCDGQLHWECERAPLLQGCLPHCAAWGECCCNHLVPSGSLKARSPLSHLG